MIIYIQFDDNSYLISTAIYIQSDDNFKITKGQINFFQEMLRNPVWDCILLTIICILFICALLCACQKNIS